VGGIARLNEELPLLLDWPSGEQISFDSKLELGSEFCTLSRKDGLWRLVDSPSVSESVISF